MLSKELVAFVVAVFFRSKSSDMLHCLPELFQIERAKFLFFFFPTLLTTSFCCFSDRVRGPLVSSGQTQHLFRLAWLLGRRELSSVSVGLCETFGLFRNLRSLFVTPVSLTGREFILPHLSGFRGGREFILPHLSDFFASENF